MNSHFLLIACCLSLCLSGCLSTNDLAVLDDLSDMWIDRIAEKDNDDSKYTPDGCSKAVDNVDYNLLSWRYGGFNGSGAQLDTPRLSNLSCDGRSVSYRWDVGMSGWGLGNGDAGAICAVFFLRDGEWIGGKFDWVSKSRASRELKHVEAYSNWPTSGIKLPWKGRVAFVVVSADGRFRSNVLTAQVK